MKTCLLIGCGAEIGANLLLLNDPLQDGFFISTVITNAPSTDKHYPHLLPIHGIVAKLALAQANALERIKVLSPNQIKIDENVVNFVFSNIEKDDINELGRFDFAVIATSKSDILPESAVAQKVRKVAPIVLGVAEADALPSIYGCLIDLPHELLPSVAPTEVSAGMFCLGSCQSNGMHASLRVLLEALASRDKDATAILSVQTDIVHPDTPNGVLGTRSFEGRMQDARNNLRPSFSQIVQSRRKVLPWADMLNTVSLRAPVQAPGYQINRFVISDEGMLLKSDIIDAAAKVHEHYPYIAMATDLPLGSRAYGNQPRCGSLVADDKHLLINRPGYLSKQGLSEVIVQSYVSNTIGYSAVVLATLRNLSAGKKVSVFEGVC